MPLQGSARSVLLEPPTAEEVAAAAAQRPDQGGQGQKNVVAAVTESLSDLWGGVSPSQHPHLTSGTTNGCRP
jgi:hypothetical protein